MTLLSSRAGSFWQRRGPGWLLFLSALTDPMSCFPAERVSPSAMIRATFPARFVAITNLQHFTRTPGTNHGETVFLSPVLPSAMPWNEAILSWNIKRATNAGFKFELQPFWTNRPSHFYHLGTWTAYPGKHSRQSVNGQKDPNGSVETDTLLLNHSCEALQIRVTVADEHPVIEPPVEFLSVSLFNRSAFDGLSTNLTAPSEILLPVPERSQIAYKGGRDWCSPTSVSMVLGYWAERLQKPALAHDVPAVAAGVHDPQWPGTGNWPFNTGFAGMLPGLRAYVTRLSGVADLQRLLKAGIPSVVSVSFDLLNGKEKDQGTGHLIVCVGTTAAGDFIINDPWANLEQGERVQRVVSVQRLVRGWSKSRGVVYLIHPIDWPMPSGQSWQGEAF